MLELNELAQGGRVLRIAQMGHPILLKKASKIEPSSDEAQQIIRDMAATIIDFGELAGLAAPQVYISKRIIFYTIHESRADDHLPNGLPMTVLINPSFEPLTDELILSWEACLSVKDMAGEVPRYKGIRYKYQTREGEWKEAEAWGYHAKVLQHEIDHLNGILYPMRMKDMRRFGNLNEVSKYS